ncbi:helix-turn-helix transcriptional regulator [Flagellimonas sp. S174]|uniref:helix-turn-helix transcriptional regulator n=1 Tax=Flagellimonas sp. S174 TaxID=3410790 RepID=UPI003BF5345E
MLINKQMNYTNTYYNLYNKQQSVLPPQFQEEENYIMRFHTKLPYYAYNGQSLIVIFFKKGQGSLIVDGKRLKVSNQKFIILNPTSHWEYINTRDEDIDVLSFALSQEMLSKQRYFKKASHHKLLNSPFESMDSDNFFFEQNFSVNCYHSGKLLSRIHNLSNIQSPSLINSDEVCMEVLESILNDQVHFYEKSKSITAVKNSTQQEIMKRLLVAFEYIHDNVTKKITIKELAVSSSLSEFHLFNSFKNVFGSTPHQYMNAQKMTKAREMLQKDSLSVSEVSTLLNFPDVPTFSKLFKKTFGKSPTHFMQ